VEKIIGFNNGLIYGYLFPPGGLIWLTVKRSDVEDEDEEKEVCESW